MTKLIFNQDMLSASVEPNLKDAVISLQRCVNSCNFNIPSDFQYSTALRNVFSQLRNCYRKIEQTDLWLTDATAKVVNAFTEIERDAGSLEVQNIKEKKPFVQTL